MSKLILFKDKIVPCVEKAIISEKPIDYNEIQGLKTVDQVNSSLRKCEKILMDLMNKFKRSKDLTEKETLLRQIMDHISNHTNLTNRAREIVSNHEIDEKVKKAVNAKQEKVHTVMKEFKEGKLKSSTGKTVTNRDQAIAIAMSESGQPCPGSKIRSKGKGQGLGYGKGAGPIGRQVNKSTSKRLVIFYKG